MAAMSFRRVIIPLFLGLTSLGLAQDQIPLVCHDQGIQIIALPGTNVTNGTYGLTQSFVNNVLGRIGSSDTFSMNYNRFHTAAQVQQVFRTEVSQGVGALQATLANYTTACPNTPIVLHGYSEGGCVVMNVICGGSSPWTTPAAPLAASYAKNIIAVILYGEETRAAGQSYDFGGCNADAPHLARSNSASCASFAPAIMDFCLADDADCCGTANASNPNATNGLSWHFNYPNYFDDIAANFVVSQHDKFVNNPVTTAKLPTGVSTVGCYVDTSARILPYFVWSSNNNTAASCALACRAAGYQYSGTESSRECYCGSTRPSDSLIIDGCWAPCTGDSRQDCGNNWRINVYFDSLAVPVAAQLPSGIVPFGCFIDTGNRVLPVMLYNNASNTQSMCALGCRAAGYIYSGTENSNECWCGAAAPTSVADNSTCNAPCPGLPYQTCGGGPGSWRINVSKDTTLTSTTPSLPPGDVSLGCYIDSWNRSLPYQAYANASNTNTLCATACSSAGYVYSGTENGNECWCGNVLPPTAATSNSSCNTFCSGSPASYCGGSFRLSVTQNTAVTSLPTGWTSIGCFGDAWTRTFPVMLWSASNNSDTACLRACEASGYGFAVTENGNECYCGGSAPASNLLSPSTDCNTPCAADGTQICGGQWRLSSFEYAAYTS